MIDHSLQGLRPLCDPLFVVANDLHPYIDVRATLLQDIVSQEGPLGGIFTALVFSPNDWLFVKAVDMPFLVPELLSAMLVLRTGADLVVPMQGDYYEPLLALYSRRCIAAIAGILEGRERRIISLFKKVRVKSIPEDQWRALDPEGRSFFNVNTPEDWERLVCN
jgi:molybdopterin-guanine dinucleotide biosynthesis protein A